MHGEWEQKRTMSCPNDVVPTQVSAAPRAPYGITNDDAELDEDVGEPDGAGGTEKEALRLLTAQMRTRQAWANIGSEWWGTWPWLFGRALDIWRVRGARCGRVRHSK